MKFLKRLFYQRGTPQHYMPALPDYGVIDRQRFLGRETETMTPVQWAILIVCAVGLVVAIWLGFVAPMLSIGRY